MTSRWIKRGGSSLLALALAQVIVSCGGNGGGGLQPLPELPTGSGGTGTGTGGTGAGTGGGTGTGTGTGSGTGTGAGTGTGTGTGSGTGTGTGTGTGSGTGTGGTGTGTGGAGTGGTGGAGTGGEASTGPARIVQQPTEVRVPLGQRGTATVVTAGSPVLQYVWFDTVGNTIPGQTGNTLTFGPVTESSNGATYRMQVSNSLTSQPVISEPIRVVVIPPLPTILNGPLPVWATPGYTVTQNVVVQSEIPVTCYQWLRNGQPIPGATGPTYSSTLQLADNDTQLSVRVCNDSGSVVTDGALIRVSATDVAPVILENPVDVTVRVGEEPNFRVLASGTEPMTYRWVVNGTQEWSRLAPGFAVPVRWTIQDAQLSYDQWSITVEVSNRAGVAVSRPVKLTVLP